MPASVVTASHVIASVSEPELVRLGEHLAFVARRGDLFALSGELGAGKTTLARAIIHALTGNKSEEIPSPTFTLVQSYATPRMPVAHLDLYRLRAPSELEELGLDLALKRGDRHRRMARAGGRLAAGEPSFWCGLTITAAAPRGV